MAGIACGPRALHAQRHRLVVGRPDVGRFDTATASRAAARPLVVGFNDPMLVTVVQRTLNQNLNLDAAFARLRQARAAASGAGAELLPTADLGASATFEHQSLRGEFGSVAAGSPGFKRDGHADVVGPSSWEIDLFGGLRRGVAASRDDAQAAEADQAGTREARCSQGSRRGSTLAVRDKSQATVAKRSSSEWGCSQQSLLTTRRMAETGQQHQFPPPEPSARYRFGQAPSRDAGQRARHAENGRSGRPKRFEPETIIWARPGSGDRARLLFPAISGLAAFGHVRDASAS
jgi:Outer membrane efflux protein